MVAQDHGIVLRTNGQNIKPFHKNIVDGRSNRYAATAVRRERPMPAAVRLCEPCQKERTKLAGIVHIEVTRYDNMFLDGKFGDKLGNLRHSFILAEVKVRPDMP